MAEAATRIAPRSFEVPEQATQEHRTARFPFNEYVQTSTALPDLSAAIEPLLRIREGMRTERKTLDRTVAAVSRRSEVGRRLMTIPGVGPVTTLAYIARIDDPGRFATSKALGAHLGLTPRVFQ